MTRIAELERQYPTIPKDAIVRWELMCRGVRDSKDLDKVSSWRPASQGTYQSFDEDLTLERLKKETPWRVRDNAVLVPDSLWTKTGLGFFPDRKERSPYTVREVGEGKVAVFEGEEMIDVDVYASPRKERTGPEPVTSRGTPVRDLVPLSRRCYHIFPVRHCEYFNTGEECKFCNFNPTQEDARSVGLKRDITLNPDETAEAFKICGSQVKLLEGFLESGGFARSETEGSLNVRFVEKLCNAIPYTTHMKLVGEAMPRRELLRLRDAGLSGVRIQMELFDERLFALVVPGKAKHLSRDGWLEAFQDAVDIFGVGNVGCKTIGGLTLQGPQGYGTWQEARDSHIEGDRWMIGHGVFPSTNTLRWAPGSPFSRDPANRLKFAPTEYYLDVMAAHHAAMTEYGLYEKMNKFLYCGLCTQTRAYHGEMGILETARDFGTWMSDVVPYELNWLAQFLDSKKAPER